MVFRLIDIDLGFEPTDERAKTGNLLLCMRSCAVGIAGCSLLNLFVLTIIVAAEGYDWSDDNTWYDGVCTHMYSFVCESMERPCPDMFFQEGEGANTGCYLNSNHWKLLNSSRRWHARHDWYGAQAECASLGSHLATIHSWAENEMVHSACGRNQPCWIGLRSPQRAARLWEWVDGSSPTFYMWADGQPAYAKSSWRDTYLEACVHMGLHPLGHEAQVKLDIFFAWVNGLTNAGFMLAGCFCFLHAFRRRNQTALLMSVASDSCCTCCLCFISFAALGGVVVRGKLEMLGTCALGFLQMGVLLCIVVTSLNVGPKLGESSYVNPQTVQVAPPSPSNNMHSGTTVIGSPVVGVPLAAGQVQPGVAVQLARPTEAWTGSSGKV